MDYIGFIYCWTNNINKKKYIGLHVGKVDDGYIGSGTYFKKAIEKYGIENFEREILYFEFNSIKNLYQKEYDIINEYNAVLSEEFYNLTNISPNAFKWVEGNLVMSDRGESWRKNLSASKLGKKMSEEAKESLKRSSFSKGKVYYNDGNIESRFFEGHQPEGWVRGRIPGRVPYHGGGSNFYTNGTEDKKFYPNDVIPEGWVRGRSKQNITKKDPNTGKFTKEAI